MSNKFTSIIFMIKGFMTCKKFYHRNALSSYGTRLPTSVVIFVKAGPATPILLLWSTQYRHLSLSNAVMKVLHFYSFSHLVFLKHFFPPPTGQFLSSLQQPAINNNTWTVCTCSSLFFTQHDYIVFSIFKTRDQSYFNVLLVPFFVNFQKILDLIINKYLFRNSQNSRSIWVLLYVIILTNFDKLTVTVQSSLVCNKILKKNL